MTIVYTAVVAEVFWVGCGSFPFFLLLYSLKSQSGVTAHLVHPGQMHTYTQTCNTQPAEMGAAIANIKDFVQKKASAKRKRKEKL